MLNYVRKVRDNLHGSVDISEIEDRVISHRFFQRLRRIRQLAFLHYVFPGATHTRFEHSLGAMHLAGLAWQKLKANQVRLMNSMSPLPPAQALEKSWDKKEVHGLLTPTFDIMSEIYDCDYSLQTLRLTALLHDLGHPPFSHSGERLMPYLSDVIKDNGTAPRYLLDFLEEKYEREKKQNPKPRASHEIFSMLMILRLLEDVSWPKTLQIASRDVLSLMSKQIEPEASSPLRKHKAYQFCRQLISGELDIDRMDYLLRDSRECGVVYGIFDSGRILDSLYLYYNPEDKGVQLAIGFAGLAALEDYLRARYSMYLQLYFHKTAVAGEAMMKYLTTMVPNLALPTDVYQYALLDEHNIGDYLVGQASMELSPTELKSFKDLLVDLLHHRKLWKRVYEQISFENKSDDSGTNIASAYLKSKKLRYESISSKNSLTRFHPRKEHEKSKNLLMLIKKDRTYFPRVTPIEEYSQLVNLNQNTLIQRIYTEPVEDLKGLKRSLSEQF
ncbi:MAG: HD domain-containing protein [Oligoflexales bacterium]